jgi:hypothetical protein
MRVVSTAVLLPILLLLPPPPALMLLLLPQIQTIEWFTLVGRIYGCTPVLRHPPPPQMS